jgi:hypothetical protein
VCLLILRWYENVGRWEDALATYDNGVIPENLAKIGISFISNYFSYLPFFATTFRSVIWAYFGFNASLFLIS